ncbi:hypothetical protein RRG08_007668 [Elysia crispata]|uniref:Uncharacterized protein n=1 Tax=Elysia crispata TaxID=231223 RepID=A0AAE1CS12_9GAST|nr:hypothetical protein RRG08_007668 [Elysia crispata]
MNFSTRDLSGVSDLCITVQTISSAGMTEFKAKARLCAWRESTSAKTIIATTLAWIPYLGPSHPASQPSLSSPTAPYLPLTRSPRDLLVAAYLKNVFRTTQQHAEIRSTRLERN